MDAALKRRTTRNSRCKGLFPTSEAVPYNSCHHGGFSHGGTSGLRTKLRVPAGAEARLPTHTATARPEAAPFQGVTRTSFSAAHKALAPFRIVTGAVSQPPRASGPLKLFWLGGAFRFGATTIFCPICFHVLSRKTVASSAAKSDVHSIKLEGVFFARLLACDQPVAVQHIPQRSSSPLAPAGGPLKLLLLEWGFSVRLNENLLPRMPHPSHALAKGGRRQSSHRRASQSKPRPFEYAQAEPKPLCVGGILTRVHRARLALRHYHQRTLALLDFPPGR